MKEKKEICNINDQNHFMKFRLLGAFVFFILFSSCTKMSTYCWKCTTTQTMYYRNGTQTSYGSSENEACGLTNADASNYEKLGSQEVRTNDGTMVSVRKCTR